MITVAQGQSTLDIATQHCGSAESAYEIAELNNLSLTDDLQVGSSISTPQVASKVVKHYYSFNKIVPATSLL